MLTGSGSEQMAETWTVRARWKLLPGERGVPTCLSYIIEGDRIRLPGNPAGVKFDFPIGDVIETEHAIVICLLVPEGRKCSENVYAIDQRGNLLWRVAPQGFRSPDAYVSLSLEGPAVNLQTRAGRICRVDPRNGSQIPDDA